MKPAALWVLAWLGLTAQDTAVVGPNETLRHVAERTLGDASAAQELRALNGLASDTVVEGTKLKVPGQDRVLANKALETARTLVAQARDANARSQAEVRLKEAETHFRAARYTEASEAANDAGKLVSAAASPQPSTFSVEVAEDGGTTKVTVKQGPPVRLVAEGVSRPVAKGESVSVERGSPPPPPLAALVAPRPAQPEDGVQLKLRPDKQGRLGPVKLAWAAVPGAERYEVEVMNDEGTSALAQPVTLAATEARLPALPAGRYQWTVRAVGASGRSESSPARRFELVVDKLKLEVQTGKWQ